jgi:hypothetical protein
MPAKILPIISIFLISISWSGQNPECDNQKYLELGKIQSDSLSKMDSGYVAFYDTHCLENESGKKDMTAGKTSDRGFDVFLVLATLALLSIYMVTKIQF